MYKIAFLINNIYPFGGTVRVTTMVASELAKQHSVSIISCRKGEDNEKIKFPLSENVYVVNLEKDTISNPIKRKIIFLRRLDQYIKKNNIDFVICVDLDLYLYCLRYNLFGNRQVKTIAWEHFNYYYHKGLKGAIVKNLSAKYADCLVVLGKNDYNNYKKRIRNIKRIEYIYNPLAFNSDRKSDLRSKNVISVGRLESIKGYDRLLKAWKLVERNVENNVNEWSLIIYGDGSEKDKLQKYIKEEHLSRVAIHPFTKKIEEAYLNASIYALPSRLEGFGLVLLEAQSKGLPIVSFDCKVGPAEIVKDGVNGFLVEDGNIEIFAEKIIELIHDERLRKLFSSHTEDNLDRFEIKSISMKWNKLFEQMVE